MVTDPSTNHAGPVLISFIDQANAANHYTTPKQKRNLKGKNVKGRVNERTLSKWQWKTSKLSRG